MNRLSNVIQSILFLSGKPVEEAFIREKLDVSTKEMKAAVAELSEKFSGESGIHLMHFNGKLQFATNPNYVHEVEAVLNPIKEKELTNAMLETLAIIAYKQPVTRLDVEEIRAVDCTYAVQNLTRLGLIEVVGRKETIGKPLLFATTDEFLKRFSIDNVTELPDYESLLEKLKNISYGNANETEKPMFDKVEDVSAENESGESTEATVNGGADGAAGAGDGDSVGGDEVSANADVVATGGEKCAKKNGTSGEVGESGAAEKRQSTSGRGGKRGGKAARQDDDLPEEEIPDFLKGEEFDVVE